MFSRAESVCDSGIERGWQIAKVWKWWISLATRVLWSDNRHEDGWDECDWLHSIVPCWSPLFPLLSTTGRPVLSVSLYLTFEALNFTTAYSPPVCHFQYSSRSLYNLIWINLRTIPHRAIWIHYKWKRVEVRNSVICAPPRMDNMYNKWLHCQGIIEDLCGERSFTWAGKFVTTRWKVETRNQEEGIK